MATVEQVAGLRARLEHARGQAGTICHRSRGLRAESTRLQSDIVDAGFPRWFVVQGLVEGRPVRARWWRGSLQVDQALRTRSELVVELGDEFETPGGRVIRADLERPLPAMLTLLRACDRALSVVFGPASAATDPELGPAG